MRRIAPLAAFLGVPGAILGILALIAAVGLTARGDGLDGLREQYAGDRPPPYPYISLEEARELTRIVAGRSVPISLYPEELSFFGEPLEEGGPPTQAAGMYFSTLNGDGAFRDEIQYLDMGAIGYPPDVVIHEALHATGFEHSEAMHRAQAGMFVEWVCTSELPQAVRYRDGHAELGTAALDCSAAPRISLDAFADNEVARQFEKER